MKYRKNLLYLFSLLLIVVIGCVGCSLGNRAHKSDISILNYTGDELKEISYRILDEDGNIVESGATVNADNSPIKKGERIYMDIDGDRFILYAEDLNGNRCESNLLRKSDIALDLSVIKGEAEHIEIVANTEKIDTSSAEKFIGFDIPNQVAAVRAIDSHGGFHGDGTTIVEVAVLFKDMEKFEKETSKWKNISEMNKGLYSFIAEARDSELEEFGTTIPENGCYKFFDDQGDTSAEDRFLNKSSLNFMVAIYDYDRAMLTFIRIDT